MPIFIAFTSGLLFGLGLIISEMVNPLRVKGFLDIFGDWDPTLLFVMMAAVPVTATGYFLLQRRDRPFLASGFNLPQKQDLDLRLFCGSALFGIGWGLSGLCPGPAIVGITTGQLEIFVFVAAMLAGMKVFEWVIPQVD